MYSLGHVTYDRYLSKRLFNGLTEYSVRHDQEGNGMKGKGKWNWTKSLLFVLMAAVMMLGVQTVRAYAQTPASKPGNVKISNPNGDDTALISWENPWGDTELAAKNDKDVTGGLVIEQSTDGGKNWEDAQTIKYTDSQKKAKQSTYLHGMQHGTAYSFRIFYYNDSQRITEAGEKVNFSIKWATKNGTAAAQEASAEQSIKRKFADKGKVTTSGGYNANSDLKKGMKVVFDRGAYTLTAEVLKVANVPQNRGNHLFYTIKYTLKSKIGKRLAVSAYTGNKYESYSWSESSDGLTRTAEITSDVKAEAACQFIRIQIKAYSPAAEANEYLEFASNPGPENLTVGDPLNYGAVPVADSTKNSVKLTNLTEGKKEIQYRKKGAQKWTSVKTSKENYTIKKLKASTEYQVRYRFYGKGQDRSGKSVSIYSEWTTTITIRTAMKKAPRVTLKASGAKYKKTRIPARWVKIGKTWYWKKAHYETATTFKLKVNGKKADGLAGYVLQSDGVRQSLKKKSGTVKFCLGGDLRGQTIKIKVAAAANKTHSGLTGLSPFTTYKVKIK